MLIFVTESIWSKQNSYQQNAQIYFNSEFLLVIL